MRGFGLLFLGASFRMRHCRCGIVGCAVSGVLLSVWYCRGVIFGGDREKASMGPSMLNVLPIR